MSDNRRIKSVAIIGAGAAGAITSAAFIEERCFDRIEVFERKESAGGTWIYDPSPSSSLSLQPGGLPPDIDPPLKIPNNLPKTTPPNEQERYTQTPIYSSLTTNVPSIAMSFSDLPFPYGPFVPHHVPRQYIESYFSHHRIDTLLNLDTTVEDVSVTRTANEEREKWKLTLRKYDSVRRVDVWWEDEFDGVIFANGHYSVPFVPQVQGLSKYLEIFPDRVIHSKIYRTPLLWKGKKVLIIGNSASGHDITTELVSIARLPVYQSRRTASRWDGAKPPHGVVWKPTVKEYLPSGRIIFEDYTYLDGIDTVIYCTGYKASFPFWNVRNNGREIWDYKGNRLVKNYLHTFFQDFSSLGVVGVPRVLTFRSFEYQAVALARLFAGRESVKLPSVVEQERWERDRRRQREKEGKKFHDIEWETGETLHWLGDLYQIAGLGLLTGEGRVPPVLGSQVRWAIENLRKYPEPGKDKDDNSKETKIHGILGSTESGDGTNGWVFVEKGIKKDLLSFV
ncbi:hypothetical protein BGZ60DRAFT_459846 [Tricladium varicosporioides]|nr:hypothetical protein BGZ60DRAFT_459846 [Hymenoscyphus varicosporioides]